jgi:ABC-type antimicrobial peptide transport system permease subunit
MRQVRAPLVLLLSVAIVLLVISCANVASLLLAQTIERVREIAIRVAIGASPTAVAQQFALETILLAVGAGLVGLIGANVLGPALLRFAGSFLPEMAPVASLMARDSVLDVHVLLSPGSL